MSITNPLKARLDEKQEQADYAAYRKTIPWWFNVLVAIGIFACACYVNWMINHIWPVGG